MDEFDLGYFVFMDAQEKAQQQPKEDENGEEHTERESLFF